MMTDSLLQFEASIDNFMRRMKDAPRQEVVLTRLCQLISGRLVGRLEERLRHHGLNHTTWIALCVLYGTVDHTLKPSELSTFLDSSRTNITRVSDELVENGWAERLPSETDRRQVYLHLTKAGVAFVESQFPALRERHRQIWSVFTKAEMETLETLLRKLQQRLGE